MISPSKEIIKLVSLLEDPDEEVYQTVANSIIELKGDAIPYLEDLLESSTDTLTVNRASALLAKLHFMDIERAFSTWLDNEQLPLPNLLTLLLKIRNPHADIAQTEAYLLKLRKSIWLECNQFLTPLEQINVFIDILFKKQHIKDYKLLFKPESYRFYFIDEITTRQLGSELLICILYYMYFELFEIPVKIVEIFPNKYYCAYVSPMAENQQQILCFIHPGYGEVYSYEDLNESLKLLNADVSQITILTKKDVVRRLLERIVLLMTKEHNVVGAYQANKLLQMLQ